jgi:adenine phosphoribosyltransferase
MVAKKEVKSYMKQPVISATRDECMTSTGGEAFFLGADQAEELKGKKVVIIDDVVSTGGSIKAMRNLLKIAEAVDAGVMCGFTEGPPSEAHEGVICLGNLPLNDAAWQ